MIPVSLIGYRALSLLSLMRDYLPCNTGSLLRLPWPRYYGKEIKLVITSDTSYLNTKRCNATRNRKIAKADISKRFSLV